MGGASSPTNVKERNKRAAVAVASVKDDALRFGEADLNGDQELDLYELTCKLPNSSRKHMLALLTYRAANALWLTIFFFVEWVRVAQTAGNPGGTLTKTMSGFPISYTSWCFRIQPFYFLLAVAASVHGLITPQTKPTAGRAASILHTLQSGMLEICLPSSWLVSLVVFTLLDPGQPRIIWNRVAHMHFWNTVVFSVEFALNRLPIRAGHFILMLLWVLLYVVFSWSMKATEWYRFVYCACAGLDPGTSG